VEQAFGSVEAFEEYLNSHPCWVFLQAEKKWINGREVTFKPSTIMLCERVKLVLSVAKLTRDGESFYSQVLAILEPNRYDRADALAGREVTEKIEVEPDIVCSPTERPTPTITAPLKATKEQVREATVTKKEEVRADEKPAKAPAVQEDHQRFLIAPVCPACGGKLLPERGQFCQACGIKLPNTLAVHKELVVSIDVNRYNELPIYLKQRMNAAWSHLIRGRRVQKVSSLGCNVFLLAIEDEMRTSTSTDEKRFEELLLETGTGTISDDKFEVKQAHVILASKHPQKAG
jgi:hypothetical protein